MMAQILVVAAIIVLPLLWVLAIYNGLVRTRNATRESWSQIDVELKRRHDLIPRLCEVVKGYAAHERGVLDAVVRSRSEAIAARRNAAAASRGEQALAGELGRLLAVAEGYPALKADSQYRYLMEQLVDTEDRIQRARRFYNGNIRDLNDRIQTFPSSLVASGFGFTAGEYFACEVVARAVPSVG